MSKAGRTPAVQDDPAASAVAQPDIRTDPRRPVPALLREVPDPAGLKLEAEVVRRIFAEDLAGKSSRDIAHGLNADGIPAPRGARWNASTINGNSTRGNGILPNPLHAGRQVRNRVRMVNDPGTGRRVSRPNPAAEWVVEPQFLALVKEQSELRTKLAEVPEPPEVIGLHPATPKRYEGQPAQLQAALARGIRAGDTEAVQAMRELIDTGTVSRDPSRKGSAEVEIAGRLTRLLGPKAFPQGVSAVWGAMVAEVCSGHSPTLCLARACI